MRKNIRTLLVLSCLSLSSIYANDACIVIGYHEPGTNTYDGPTYCNNVNISNITVRGPLVASNAIFTGKTDVSGPITVSTTTLDQIVSESNGTPTKVTLKSASTVKGDIDFEGLLPGKVYLESGSHVDGKIINGKILSAK